MYFTATNQLTMKNIFRVNLLRAAAILAFLLPAQCFAQLEISGGIGYGFGLGKGLIGANSVQTYTQTTGAGVQTYTDEGVYGSWGQGLDANLRFSRMLCEHFGAGLEFSYLSGRKFKIEESLTQSAMGNLYTERLEYTGNLRSVRLSPQIYYRGEDCAGFTPYSRVGLQLNLSNSMKQTYRETTIDNAITTVYEEEAKVKGKFNMGFNAAIGAMYNLSDNLGIYGEGFFNNSAFVPKTWELTSYTVDGQDELNNLTTSQKRIEYEKEISGSSALPPDPNSPTKALANPMPAGAWGLRLGLIYHFGDPKAVPPPAP